MSSPSRPWVFEYPPGVESEIGPLPFPSVPALLDDACVKFADRPALSSFQQQMTFAELSQHATAFAAFLRETLGVQKGDRVAIMLPNLLQYPIALIGALRAGAVIVNVNPLYTPRELQHQLADSGATAMVIFAPALAALQPIQGDTQVRHVIATGPTDMLPGAGVFDPPDGVHGFAEALERGAGASFDPVPLTETDVALLQYTGGTTGVSKGAVLTHRNVLANLEQFEVMAGDFLRQKEQVIITALPLYHIFGFTVNLMAYLRMGGLNVLIANPREMPKFVEELGRWKFTSFTGVNTLFNGLMHTPGFADLDFSELHFTVGGGMAVQRPVAERWHEMTGCHVLEGYGLSETSPILTMNPIHLGQFTGSIGIPMPSTEISIRDEHGRPVPYGEPGELCARGPQVMDGYWQRAEATAEVMTEDGFFRTGDVATMDERGYSKIVDRKKDMILVSGFNVFPNEVEEVLASHPAVLEAACVGVADDKSTEAVKAFVVKAPGAEVEVGELVQHCRESLAGYKIPSSFEFIDEIPKSAVGKILRRELRS